MENIFQIKNNISMKIQTKILLFIISMILLMTSIIPVQAATVSQLRDEKEIAENELSELESYIEEKTDEIITLENDIEQLSNSLEDVINNLNDIDGTLNEKKESLKIVQVAYENAKQEENEDYKALKEKVDSYNVGDENYLSYLLNSNSLDDLFNKISYTKEERESDQALLDEYEKSKEIAETLKNQYETETEELEELQNNLELTKSTIEEKIENKTAEIENLSNELEELNIQEDEYILLIESKTVQINKLEGEQKTIDEANEVVANTDGTLGTKIATFALQFVGYPYVAGGSSLTNGTDCSGFTQSVYKNFGIDIPRTSGTQASGSGETIGVEDILPGDIVCYSGHVGIYIGNGQIVHASTEATGIKVGNMDYRPIICVKRYW